MKAGTEIPEDSSVKKVRVFERAGRGGIRGERGAPQVGPLAPKEIRLDRFGLPRAIKNDPKI